MPSPHPRGGPPARDADPAVMPSPLPRGDVAAIPPGAPAPSSTAAMPSPLPRGAAPGAPSSTAAMPSPLPRGAAPGAQTPLGPGAADAARAVAMPSPAPFGAAAMPSPAAPVPSPVPFAAAPMPSPGAPMPSPGVPLPSPAPFGAPMPPAPFGAAPAPALAPEPSRALPPHALVGDAPTAPAPPPEPAPRRRRGRAEPDPLAEPRPPRSPWLRITLLAAIVLVLLVALVSTLRYRRAADARDSRLEAVAEALEDGNFGSRVEQAERLAAPLPAADLFAAIGDAAACAAGRPGLAAADARRAALHARVEAERVGLFGERPRRAAADDALAAARALAPDALDTRAAAVLLALADGDARSAAAALADLPVAAAESADAAWLAALVAREQDRLDAALAAARTAAQRQVDHPFAATLVGELQAERGDLAGGLATLEQLLDRARAGHVDTRIAFERLRIRVGKRAGEAVGNLRALLDNTATALSPAQQARIHDAIGEYHDSVDEPDAAREAFRRAMEAAPGVPAFMAGVARIDLRRHALDEAEAVLTEAAARAPSDPRWIVQLARVDLARGNPEGALARLDAIEEPGPEARFVAGQARLDLADEAADAESRAPLLQAAEADFEAADAQSGGLADAVLLGHLARDRRAPDAAALDALRRARTAGSSDRPLRDRALPFRAYGRALAARGKHRAALRQFQNAAEVDPQDDRARAFACAAAAARLDSKTALDMCRQALVINPHLFPAARRLARVAEGWRDAGAIIAALAPFAARAPLPPADARRLARALVEQDRHDDALALADGERATDDDATRRYIRGIVATARGRLGEARDNLQAAADQLTADAWAQVAYAALLLAQDDAARAASYYRRAMTADDEPYAALGLARAELDRDDPEAARVAAREAERRAARSLSHPRLRAEALAVQAHALVAKGGRRELRQAEALLGKADAVEPDLPEALLAAALLAEKQRRPDRAIARYRRLTEVAPRHAEAWFRMARLLMAERDGRAAGEQALAEAAKVDPEGIWGARARRAMGR